MQNALVQGASGGIGLAVVEALLRREPAGRVVATARAPEACEGLVRLQGEFGEALTLLRLDVQDEASIAAAAAAVGERLDRLHLVMNTSGVLHDGEALRPEKRLEAAAAEPLLRSFAVNAVGPLLVAKHLLPFLRHDERSVFASLSARVGSLGDNRAGGWYGYRASKAALNMFTVNLAIELRRRAPQAICVALHPGTVDTPLSQPFQRSVPAHRLFDAKRAADQLLGVIDRLRPEQSGGLFAWDGQPIPW